MATTSALGDEPSLLDKLDSLGTPLKSFDAFPKLPSTYKSRSAGGGFITFLIGLLCFLLVLNDLAEFIWGVTTYSFYVDHELAKEMKLNVDITVAMPCRFISVDLRDAVGDRLHLSDQFKRDGTLFDANQATNILKEASRLSAGQAIREAKSSRSRAGFFDWIRNRQPSAFQPTFHHTRDGSACRIYGSMDVKKVQANLHITTLGHGYHSSEHTDHKLMNLSHIITEFSFGPYFPAIVQPLDYTIEVSDEPFTAFQYFLTVVPTTYKTPSSSISTNQYSVTSHIRPIVHGRGTPGIFFKYDLEPVSLVVEQKTTTLIQFLIRFVGVVGGVWVCAGWAVKVGSKGLEVSGLAKKDDVILVVNEPVSRRQSMMSIDAVRKRASWGGSLSGLATFEGSGALPSHSPSPSLSGTFSPPASGTPSFNQPQFANMPMRHAYTNSAASTPLSSVFLPSGPNTPNTPGSPSFVSHRPSASTQRVVGPTRMGSVSMRHQPSANMGGPAPAETDRYNEPQ